MQRPRQNGVDSADKKQIQHWLAATNVGCGAAADGLLALQRGCFVAELVGLAVVIVAIPILLVHVFLFAHHGGVDCTGVGVVFVGRYRRRLCPVNVGMSVGQ